MLIIEITNDGTGDVHIGYYDYKVKVNKEVIAQGRVEAHDRSYGWQTLVRRLLQVDYKDGSGV